MVKQKLYKGVVDMTADGNAFIVSEELKKDTFIPQRQTRRALNKDIVLFRLTPSRSKGNKQNGEITNIVERQDHEYTGTLKLTKKEALFAADDRKMPYYIFIPFNNLKDAVDGDKIVVKFLRWGEHDELPTGEVIKVLGRPGEHTTEIESILYEFDIEEDFSAAAESESHDLNNKIDAREIKRRRDFRDMLTFTIDPDDAKDFDDAISFVTLENGNYEIGVHIADVTHYIRPNTHLERAAQDRATSVYLVDRVVPMLPEKISNVLCSLRPDEDKLTFSAVFEMTPDAKVVKEWFGKTIIHSNKRFTYDEVQRVLETHHGPYAEELLTINSVAKILKNQRFKNGAINFESDEIKIKLDKNKNVISISLYERKDAHKLIEELMLLANKKVAEVLNKAKYTSVNRVHEAPENEKLENLSLFAKRFGYTIDTKSNRSIANSINKMLRESEGKPEQNIISHFAVRSMPKAFYTVKKSGHYGLAFAHYAHFTSPIRRYPDMMTHRLLESFLHHAASPDPEALEKLCKHSTQKEINASEAERASKKFKQMEYLEKLIGQKFDAIISGTTEWGIYAEIIENKCEGMIRLVNMTDDQYIYDEENYRVVGKRNKATFQVGDRILIKVLGADPVKRQADFELLEKL
jgi:ribonuclease R